jgi:hypothetical protein
MGKDQSMVPGLLTLPSGVDHACPS